ncbi:irregular chiasm C-roughest protein-like isoform X1 [Ptychodera flava]|uniref:irregular chiasm C-roughest protein-like isoform X1 n=1 Tax=Ptychodera flava TaxID=63121 RepID=UPI00396AA0CF
MTTKMSTAIAVFVTATFFVFSVEAYLSQPTGVKYLEYLGKKARRAEQTIDVNPEDVTASVGDEVMFRCHISNREGRVVWGKDGSDMLTVDRLILKHKNRISLVGEDGQYDLIIKDVQSSDAGVYNCYASKGANSPSVKSTDAVLEVV